MVSPELGTKSQAILAAVRIVSGSAMPYQEMRVLSPEFSRGSFCQPHSIQWHKVMPTSFFLTREACPGLSNESEHHYRVHSTDTAGTEGISVAKEGVVPNLDYPDILGLFEDYRDPERTDSAAFLIWYLRHYYRLDSLEAVDTVCDQRGDKGVDGIYVNDDDGTVEVFQCKLVQDRTSRIGDRPLREFGGTLAQFSSPEAIDNLIASAGRAEVALLAQRLKLTDVVRTHTVRGVFVSNTDVDDNGTGYLRTADNIQFVGRTILQSAYISDIRTSPAFGPADFDVTGYPIAQYVVDSNVKTLIATVKAADLVRLEGIPNQSLFAFNVRGPLGKTQVNRDIQASIRDATSHKLFPLFHNGITIICDQMESNQDTITVSGYFVVNGCQSLFALYNNQGQITDDLRILTKFVRLDTGSPLSERVTRYSNNQNAVRPRDFKANDPIQIRLQNEFTQQYQEVYSYEIKRGETPGSGEVISNEQAGLYLWSFDLKEPWATHRAYQVFDQKHAELFGRPVVTADRIVALHEMMRCIVDRREAIENSLFGKYVLTQYAIMYILRVILEGEAQGQELIRDPGCFVRTPTLREHLRNAIGQIIDDVIVDLNGEVEQYGEEFAYRDHLRDQEWVKRVTSDVVGNYRKLVQRHRVESFSTQWCQLLSTG